MQLSLLKIPDNHELLSSNRAETLRPKASSPLSSLIKKTSTSPNVQVYKSSQLRNITPKRNLAISITGTTSPSGLSSKACKKDFDPLTTSIEGTVRSKRPSVSSTRFSEASTKAGTITSLSKLSLRILQSPQSLNSLQSEGVVTQINNGKNGFNTLNGFESHSHRGEQQVNKETNSFLTSNKDEITTRRDSFSSANNGINLQKAIETCTTQRSSGTAHKIEYTKDLIKSAQASLSNKASKKITRTFDRSNRVKKSESLERIWNTQNTAVISKGGDTDKQDCDEANKTQKRKEKRVCLRLLTEENPKTSITFRTRERVKDRKLVQSSVTGLCIKTFSETVSPHQSIANQIRREIEEFPRTTVNAIDNRAENEKDDTQVEETKRDKEYQKLGRKGMMMQRLHEKRNSRGQSEILTENMPTKDCEQNKSESYGIIIRKRVRREDQEDESGLKEEAQRAKRPTLMRVKSELYGARKDFNTEENGFVLNDDVCANSKEKLSVNQILSNDKEVKREISQTDRSRRKRLEEWIKLKREGSSDNSEAWKGNMKIVEEILRRNMWEDGNECKEKDMELKLFKQEGHKFFELNVDNKYLQKYNVNKEENFNTERIETGTYRPTLQDDLQFKSTQTNLPSEATLKTCKSEKYMKTDPSTMMVRYYDELNPLVIQPKFMENTGSMCVTELWSNRSKQDFYKIMRKPFQSNTILSLSSSSGIYRPEKSVDSETMRNRRLRNERIDNRENEYSGSSVSRSGEKSHGLLRPSSNFRHTRAFVLQGGNESARPKKSSRSFLTRELL